MERVRSEPAEGGTRPPTEFPNETEHLEKEIIANILKNPVEVEPTPKKKRIVSESQKEHLKQARVKAMEAKRVNAVKRKEEKKLEKQVVIDSMVNERVEKKLQDSHEKLLSKYEVLQEQYERLINKTKDPVAVVEEGGTKTPQVVEPKKQRKPRVKKTVEQPVEPQPTYYQRPIPNFDL